MRPVRDPLARLGRGPLRRRLSAAARCAETRGESLYLVGGCVRDLILGMELHDLDLVVEGDPMALGASIAAALGGRVERTSLFGTCRIGDVENLRIDLAMSRRETYAAPAALPEVTPAPIEEDLRRRDLTINAMAVALTGSARGEILDPTGGLADLRARLMRLLHAGSLADDPTRAYRAARYSVRLGLRKTPIWKEALVIARRARAFDRLSPARLRREIGLIWTEMDPASVLQWCQTQGLLRPLHPSLRAGADLTRSLGRAASAWRSDSVPSIDLFWALLARALPARSRPTLFERVGIDGVARERWLEAAAAPEILSRAARSRRAWIDLLASGISDLGALVVEAAGGERERRLLRRIAEAAERSRPRLRGDDLLALGVPEGPRVGKVLESLRQARAAGKIATREEEARWVRKFLDGADALP